MPSYATGSGPGLFEEKGIDNVEISSEIREAVTACMHNR